MNRINVGIIGTGKHGSRYANHIVNDVEGLHLAAVCRRSEAVIEQGKKWNCQAFCNWQDLVESSLVDAVIAVVPPMLNFKIAKRVVAAGKPLLIEKPLAGNEKDAAATLSLCEDKNIPLTVGQILRYNPVVQAMKKVLSGLGHLHSFSANQRLEPSTLAWHEDPDLAGAGVSFHTAVHMIDAIRFITGLETKRVLAVTRNIHNQQLEDLLAVLVEMENGVIGTMDCSKVGHARSGRLEFVCNDGHLIGDHVHNHFIKGERLTQTRLDTGKQVSTIIPFLEHWRNYLNGEATNPVSGREGLAAVRFCNGCLASAANNTWVTVS